jgi:hypothetical protein
MHDPISAEESSREWVPLREVLKVIPGGRRLHITTVVRWCTRGVKLRSGEVVRLAHLRLGGGPLLSSEAAVLTFLAATTAGRLTDSPATPTVTPSAATRAAKRADAALAEMLE